LSAAVKEGALLEEAATEVSSSLRKLKGLFPNSSLSKHTPLDIYLSAPLKDRQRALVFRDLGSVEDDWVATEFALHYFEGSGPSPPVSNVDFSKIPFPNNPPVSSKIPYSRL
jgi:hypothetical protein